ncbi:hypothetical protein DFH09DRAFT_96580 [Mycena vulgaris]|nr:hypothetical protein DFH09DRAFT_96580 [Mycena vulgaris]
MATLDSGGSSQFTSNITRGGACSNCRRRKIKCDGGRPVCNQCRVRPPRSGAPCLFDLDGGPPHQSAAQMQETIKALKGRINDLERISGHAGPPVFLQQPYFSGSSHPGPTGVSTLESVSQDPPSQIVTTLVNCFLARFTNSGYFFLEPREFYKSAVFHFPSGGPERPSLALLNAVYVWGCVLSVSPPASTEDAFLQRALQSLPGDINRLSLHPKLVVETIQAEVLLSLYYLHAALPVQGRYHATAAASFALSAGLQQVRTLPGAASPRFPLLEPLLPPVTDAGEEAERGGAFWAVVTLNNYWVAADGRPSAIPYGMAIDTPWPFSSQGGGTVRAFLSGDEQEGRSPVALLVKASILLERIIAFSARNSTEPPDAEALQFLDARLHAFRSSLPPFSGSQPLFMAHVVADLAIVRLHAPLARRSDPARHKCMAAANRIVDALAAVNFAEAADPMLALVYATVATVYITDEMTALRTGRSGAQACAEYLELDRRVKSLMDTMTSLAPKSPVMQRCLDATRQTYAALAHPR